MHRFYFIIICVLFSLAQSCLGESESVFTRYSIQGSSSAWVYHGCGFSFPNEAPSKMDQLTPYLTYLQTKLKGTWHPSAGTKGDNNFLTVLFDLSKSGEISKIQISHTSGSAATDASLIRALNKLPALKPLPVGLPDIELTLMFKYESNVIKSHHWSQIRILHSL